MNSSNDIMIFEAELMPLIRERLAAGQTVRYLPFRGVSMLPMLRQGKDQVELSPLPEKLQKYDLPVYQYPSGKYVMHRVVAVEEDYYVCNGDNLLEMEKIPHDWMIAIVTAFTRNGRRIEVTDWRYRLYARFWCAVRPVRHGYRRMKSGIKRLLKAILRRG